MSETPVYSYWVVEVNHDTSEIQIDHDATQFWISRIFYPESNVMRFTEDKNGNHERQTIEDENVWDQGRVILDRAIEKPRA